MLTLTPEQKEELADCNTIEGLVRLEYGELQDLCCRFIDLYQRRKTRLLEWCIHTCTRELDRRQDPELSEGQWLVVPPLSDYADAGDSMLLLNHLAYQVLSESQGRFVDELHLRCLLACAAAAKAFGSYFPRYREKQNDD